MQEEAQALFPVGRPLLLLAVLWIVAVGGILFLVGMNGRSLVGALFSLVLLWLSYLDLRDGFLYDAITVPFAAVGIVFSLMGLLVPIGNALIGGTLCGVLFYCVYIAARGGLGGGDVKLAIGLGVWLGWEAAIVAVWTAFLLGGAAAVFLLAARRRGRHDGIPFGPFLSLGGYIGFVVGDQLWQIYWGIL